MASEGRQESDRNPVVKDGHLPVNEMLGEYQGANSPFGDDRVFPLPVEKIAYVHPDPDVAPHD